MAFKKKSLTKENNERTKNLWFVNGMKISLGYFCSYSDYKTVQFTVIHSNSKHIVRFNEEKKTNTEWQTIICWVASWCPLPLLHTAHCGVWINFHVTCKYDSCCTMQERREKKSALIGKSYNCLRENYVTFAAQKVWLSTVPIVYV